MMKSFISVLCIGGILLFFNGCSKGKRCPILSMRLRPMTSDQPDDACYVRGMRFPANPNVIVRTKNGFVNMEDALEAMESLRIIIVISGDGFEYTFHLSKNVSANVALMSVKRSDGRLDFGWKLNHPTHDFYNLRITKIRCIDIPASYELLEVERSK